MFLLTLLAALLPAGLSKDDKAWLQEVAVLILPAERAAFESLRSQDDRAEFKRIFWARRDPDLATPANEFQEAFTARRAEADKRFHTGLVRRVPRTGDLDDPGNEQARMEQIQVRQARDFAEREAKEGSLTDCGRVFIFLGEPSEVRKLNMTVWGTREPQVWTYAAVGSRFQFDESCSLPPWGHRLREDLAQRAVQQPNLEYHVEGGRLTRTLESLLPKMKTSPLRELIHDGRRDFELDAENSFLKIADGATGVCGLLRGDARGLAFTQAGGARQVRLSLRTELQREGGGRIVVPDQDLRADVGADGSFLASYRLGLRPGRYTLKVGVLEPLSGKGSVVTLPVAAPDFDTGELTIASLLALEDIKPARKDPSHSLSGFEIGESLFVPRFGGAFRRSESLLVSYQYYDPKIDEATGKPRTGARLTIAPADGPPIAEAPEEEFDSVVAGGVLGPVKLAGYAPGDYTIRLTVTDKVAGKAYTRDASFRVEGEAPPLPLRLLPPVLIEGEADWTLEERMRHYKVEAVSVALIKDFRVAWESATGLADRETGQRATAQTLFQAGSISKPVAAAAVVRKAQDGAWKLDADVNAYLKSWKVPENEHTTARKVSLELLLSHGAGLTVHGFPGYAPGEPVPTVPQILDGAPPANTAAVRVDTEPGKIWRYSGGGYTVAQLALADTFGRPFPDLLRELVLQPAGMTRSTYEQPLPPDKLALAAAGYRRDGSPVPGKRHTYPEMAAAGLWTTAGDLARFGAAIAQARRGDQGAIVSKEMAERMTSVFIGDYGLGFGITKMGKAAYFGHGGADEGFQAFLIVHREGGYGAAVMANSDNGMAIAQEIVRGLAREQGWEDYVPAPLPKKPLSAETLARVPGRYQLHGDDAVTLEARGQRLFAVPALGDEYELFAVADDLFARRERSFRYRVESVGGRVTALTLVDGPQSTPLPRLAPGATIPFDDLKAGRIDAALARYRTLFAAKPNDRGVAERRLNDVGYLLAARREFPQAVALLRLNTELYVGSTNTYDSLADVLLQSGDKAGALAVYRQLLEAAAGDTTTPPAVKDQLRRNAEAKIKELAP